MHDHQSAKAPIRKERLAGLAIAASFLLVSAAATAPREFKPDGYVTALAGTQAIGQADWKVVNGEIVGTARPGASGGWLIIDKPLQDVHFATEFTCVGDCKAGAMFRVAPQGQGYKGSFLSLANGDLKGYRVTLDANGAFTSRVAMDPSVGNRRFTSIAADNVQGGISPKEAAADAALLARAKAFIAGPGAPAAGGGPGGGGGRARPEPVLKAGENEVEIFADGDILGYILNGQELPGGDMGDKATGYGKIALFVGSGEVHYKDVAYKNLRLKSFGTPYTSPRFRVQNVTPFSYTYGVDAADIDHDGKVDLVSGPFYYPGPDFTQQREIYPPETLNPGVVAPIGSRMQFAYDWTGDGWPDVIRLQPGQGTLYVNPRGEERRWDKFPVVAITSEIAVLRDIDGDNVPELLYGAAGTAGYGYAKPNPADPTKPWIFTSVSKDVPVNIHGVGVGDVNRDNRLDIVAPAGWWEQPAKGAPAGLWNYHPSRLGAGGAEMCVYDVNGDGRNDIVTSLAAHFWGLSWFEQAADGSFAEHKVMGDYSAKNPGDVTFSELHGSACADVNGDGITDFITGKRFWSHVENYSGPDPYGAPVLYAFNTKRNPKAPGGAEFVPELLNNRTGIGSTMVVRDLNGDGKTDIVVATVLGLNILWGVR
jgi:hypothetical protein